MLAEITIARLLFAWLCILTTIIIFMTYNENNIHKTNIGPSEELIIFGTPINTLQKYIAVVALCICNSAFRAINTNIIHPWKINNIQDIKIYYKVNTYHAYEITAIHATYGFVDWYFYINILLAQIDLFMIEMIVDLCTAMLTTRYYLNVKSQTQTLPKEATKYILTRQYEIDAIDNIN